MNLLELECPNCNATLDIEDGLDVFYCKYCGTKLLVEGMSGDSLSARVRLKELEHEERLREADYDQRRFELEHQSKQKRNKLKYALILAGILILLIVALAGGVQISHRQNVANLERLETEIQADIMAGNYDSALLKTNDLDLHDNYSWDEERIWDQKREMYVDMINEKKHTTESGERQ